MIQRLRTQDDYNVNLKTVVAICIGMHLPPLVSRHLIESAGLSFKYANKEHMLYDFFITSYYCHTIDECNEMLHAQGFKSLSGDEERMKIIIKLKQKKNRHIASN